jgi:hypothetical protein
VDREALANKNQEQNQEQTKQEQNQESAALFSSPKRPSEYYRTSPPERAAPGSAMPILIGAA